MHVNTSNAVEAKECFKSRIEKHGSVDSWQQRMLVTR